jgi:hypothetical protein
MEFEQDRYPFPQHIYITGRPVGARRFGGAAAEVGNLLLDLVAQQQILE